MTPASDVPAAVRALLAGLVDYAGTTAGHALVAELQALGLNV